MYSARSGERRVFAPGATNISTTPTAMSKATFGFVFIRFCNTDDNIDFTMGKTLEVVQDPKGGNQGISLGSISGIR